MPIVLIVFAVGIGVGYWLCRMQLRGKFLLAEEAMEEAKGMTPPLPQPTDTPGELPGPWCRPEESPLALSQQWGLPNYHNAPQQSPEYALRNAPLIREDGRPQWSARWIICDQF